MTKHPGDMVKKKLHLRYVGLEPRTLRAYRQALDNFLKFSKHKRLGCASARKLDHAVSEFINHSYQEGEPLSYSGHLLSAIKRFHPEFKLKLPLSSQLYRNWVRACHSRLMGVGGGHDRPSPVSRAIAARAALGACISLHASHQRDAGSYPCSRHGA